MRGKGVTKDGGILLCGITPAYAGKRLHERLICLLKQDHPCVCGEK